MWELIIGPSAQPVRWLQFQRVSDSQFTWIHDFEENWTESIGPVLFSAEYLICRHVQTKDGLTDGRTHRRMDELIWGGLGNLRFLQVNYHKSYYVQFGQTRVFLIAVCEHSKAAAGRLERPQCGLSLW